MYRIHSKGEFRQEEAVAGAAGIKPGMLVKLNSAGQAIVHASQGGRAEKAFAIEDALQSKTVDDAYVSGSIVSYILPGQGSEVNALIEAGQDIAVGDELISAGNGKLKKASDADSGVTVAEVVAIAMEAVNLTASGAVDTLAAVRVK